MNFSTAGLIRVVVALIFISHGVARIAYHNMTGFGGFLEGQGLPMGIAWAWAITGIEIVGGVLLAIGRYVVPLACYFIFQCALGIWMIHWHAGWFVVGPGRNGMEFSVLLIACLLAMALGRR